MKKNKILIPFACLATIAPITCFLPSCGGTSSDVEKIAQAIYSPLDKQKEIITDFKAKLQTLNDEQLTNELFYDLFGYFNLKGGWGLKWVLKNEDSLTSLYKDGTVLFKANITHKKFMFNDNHDLVTNFLGYCSFVFMKEYKDGDTTLFKPDDYIMITYDIDETNVEIDQNNCSLKFNINPTDPEACVGFVKIKKNTKESLSYIKVVNTQDYRNASLPSNSNNWSLN